MLPDHLDALLDQPWSSKASLRVDYWLWYCQEEFERLAPKDEQYSLSQPPDTSE